MVDPLLIYGANGYTGRLIAAHAAAIGLAPILAGRDGAAVREVAAPLGLATRTFSLDEPDPILANLEGVQCVLHAAGPFSRTAAPMLEACLNAGVHYVDVTGEIDVFELAARLDERARSAEIMLLPGAGFDVVPSDCLGAYAAAQAVAPVHLRVGILGLSQSSHGTAKTALESLHKPTRVRRNGEIVTREPGSLTHVFDFGRGPRRVVAVSWGDVATAYHATGIPNITAYLPAKRIETGLRFSRLFGRALTTRPVQALLKALVELQPEGPDAEALEEGQGILVTQVESADGTVIEARLRTPNPYKLTYLAAVDIGRRVLSGDWRPGYQTPSTAYGAEYVLSLPGCRLEE